MKKQISLLKSHYIICGFGRVGAAATDQLKKAGSDLVSIETNPTQLQEVRGKGYCYVEGDATHENVLLEAGVKSARGLLVLLNSDQIICSLFSLLESYTPLSTLLQELKRLLRRKRFYKQERTVLFHLLPQQANRLLMIYLQPRESRQSCLKHLLEPTLFPSGSRSRMN